MAWTTLEIEAALLAALEPLKAEAGVATIEAVADDEAAVVARNTFRHPAILSYYAGMENEDRGQRQFEEYTYWLFCAAKHLRSKESALPGARELLQLAREKLRGKILLEGLFPAVLCREQAMPVDGAGLVVYAAEYRIKQAVLL